MIIRELLTVLGFDLNDADARKYEQRLNGIQKKAENVANRVAKAAAPAIRQVGVAAGAISAKVAVAAGVQASAATAAFAKSIGDIEDMARGIEISGLDAEKFQTWASVASDSFGWSAEKFADVMKDVNDRVGQLTGEATGELKGLIDAYGKRAGMSAADFVGDDAAGTIQKVALMMQKAGASQAEITAAGEALANDASVLLKFAMQGNGELERRLELAKAGIMLTEEEIKAVKDLQTQRRRLTGWFDDIRFKISAGLAPVITDLLQRWNEWLAANKELVQLRIDKTIRFIANGLRVAGWIVGTATRWFNAAAEAIGGADNALRLFGGFMSGAFVLALGSLLFYLLPLMPALLLAGVLITGLGLAVNDLWTWFRGGDSLIGRFIAWLDKLSGSVGDQMGRIGGWKGALVDLAIAIERVVKAYQALRGEREAREKSGEGNGLGQSLKDGWNLLSKIGDQSARWVVTRFIDEKAIDDAKAKFDGLLADLGTQWNGMWVTLSAKIGSELSGAWATIQTEWNGLMTRLGSGWDAVFDPLKAAWDSIVGGLGRKWDEFKAGLSLPDWFTGIFGGGGEKVDERAKGGPVRGGGLYLVGEEGPELLEMGGNGFVTPARQSRSVLDAARERLAPFAGGLGRVAAVASTYAARGAASAPSLGGLPFSSPGALAPAGGGGGGLSIGSINAPVTLNVERGAIPDGVSEERVAEILSDRFSGQFQKEFGRELRKASRHFTEQE